jgi:hypothetical protein
LSRSKLCEDVFSHVVANVVEAVGGRCAIVCRPSDVVSGVMTVQLVREDKGYRWAVLAPLDIEAGLNPKLCKYVVDGAIRRLPERVELIRDLGTIGERR